MADAGFFKGTSADQDSRFSDKDQKLRKSLKFPPEFEQKVDMKKVQLTVIRPWVVKKVEDILGFEDEVVVEYVTQQLEDTSRAPDPKDMQIKLTGFLTSKTPEFMLSLWRLLLSAQSTSHGVPRELLDQKKAEMAAQREKDQSALVEASRRQQGYQRLDEIRERERRERGERGYGGRGGYEGGRGRGGYGGGGRGRDGGWGGRGGRRDYGPPRRDDRDRDRSPPRRFSPRRRSPSPRRRSPPLRRSPPPRHRSRSPIRRRRSPSYSRSPSRSPPPLRRRRSPTRSPSRSRSPPPRRRGDRSPLSSRSPSRSRSISRSRSPPPQRRGKSPMGRRPPPRSPSRSPSRSRSPPPPRRNGRPVLPSPSRSRSRSRTPLIDRMASPAPPQPRGGGLNIKGAANRAPPRRSPSRSPPPPRRQQRGSPSPRSRSRSPPSRSRGTRRRRNSDYDDDYSDHRSGSPPRNGGAPPSKRPRRSPSESRSRSPPLRREYSPEPVRGVRKGRVLGEGLSSSRWIDDRVHEDERKADLNRAEREAKEKLLRQKIINSRKRSD